MFLHIFNWRQKTQTVRTFVKFFTPYTTNRIDQSIYLNVMRTSEQAVERSNKIYITLLRSGDNWIPESSHGAGPDPVPGSTGAIGPARRRRLRPNAFDIEMLCFSPICSPHNWGTNAFSRGFSVRTRWNGILKRTHSRTVCVLRDKLGAAAG